MAGPPCAGRLESLCCLPRSRDLHDQHRVKEGGESSAVRSAQGQEGEEGEESSACCMLLLLLLMMNAGQGQTRSLSEQLTTAVDETHKTLNSEPTTFISLSIRSQRASAGCLYLKWHGRRELNRLEISAQRMSECSNCKAFGQLGFLHLHTFSF
ncbi:hypothetical protein ACO22_03104 [Paracoccidioides brasiliensis]|uniref:Uncharacterized protein n=1 Tax=Paracoccidioides brasiliensis TaxID=121759 RepID=A0A1D2JH74_PARBR|nr:hypothetical protein ACO22_03104 [Paracoccidioides brasiliensis]